MILGVGVDLCPIERMERALKHHPERLAARLFTIRERAYCDSKAQPVQHLAARFAAKEALLKALAVPGGFTWHEMEVMVGPGGAPSFVLHGEAALAAERARVSRVHLSLTHAGGQAMAFVVVEG